MREYEMNPDVADMLPIIDRAADALGICPLARAEAYIRFRRALRRNDPRWLTKRAVMSLPRELANALYPRNRERRRIAMKRRASDIQATIDLIALAGAGYAIPRCPTPLRTGYRRQPARHVV